MLAFEAGAFYVMDRGYLDFTRLHRLHQSGAFFVTRAKRGMDARRVYSTPVDRSTGLICDQLVMLAGYYRHRMARRQLDRGRQAGKTAADDDDALAPVGHGVPVAAVSFMVSIAEDREGLPDRSAHDPSAAHPAESACCGYGATGAGSAGSPDS